MFTANLDHMRIGPDVTGENIYNGAMDNAAGCSVILQVARWFEILPKPPREESRLGCAHGRGAGSSGFSRFRQPFFARRYHHQERQC
ncbi:MAG: M28 family peptidase [Bryobacteraceae bacterium]